MKKFLIFVLLVISLLSVVVGGWSFYEDPYHNVAIGIRMVLNGQAGERAVVMENENMILISYPTGRQLVNQGYAIFSKISNTPVDDFLKNAGGIGTKVSPKNARELFKVLEGEGWKYSTPEAIPVAIRVAVTVRDAAGTLASLRPIILVVPAGMFQYSIYDRSVQ